MNRGNSEFGVGPCCGGVRPGTGTCFTQGGVSLHVRTRWKEAPADRRDHRHASHISRVTRICLPYPCCHASSTAQCLEPALASHARRPCSDKRHAAAAVDEAISRGGQQRQHPALASNGRSPRSEGHHTLSVVDAPASNDGGGSSGSLL
mmetsp:Transcript_20304/g.60313  ORF Transcript_20304/g.60313 Transcript_20304/m.60313 type:complete len:149 (+) Transcript_20304:721-1167(+)